MDKYNEDYTGLSESGYEIPGKVPAVFSTNNGAAKTWARTLLGTPNMAHMILGYHQIAPGAVASKPIVNRFYTNMFTYQTTVLDAWYVANDTFGASSNWAAVTHNANRNDYMPGIKTGVTPNTRTADPYYIDYYRSDSTNAGHLAGRILDGRGGGYEEVSNINSFFQSLLGFIRQKITIISKQFRKNEQPKENKEDTIISKGTEYRIQVDIPDIKSLENFEYSSGVKNDKFINSLFNGINATNEKDEKQNNIKLYKKGTSILKVWPTGAINYHREQKVADNKISYSPEQALRTARDFIVNNDDVPYKMYVDSVHEVTKTKLDLNSNSDEPPEVLEYKITLRKSINGVPVEGNEAEKISVTVDNNGVKGYSRHMGSYIPQGSEISESSMIQGKNALNIVINNAEEIGDLPEKVNVTNMALVYYAGTYYNNLKFLKPSWKITLNNSINCYVDAVSGKILKG